MARTGHTRQPAAQSARGVVIAAWVFIRDDRGHVLLQRQTGDGPWTLPGGVLADREAPAHALRHALHRLGISMDVTGLVGVYRDRDVDVDGTPHEQVSICLRANPLEYPRALPGNARWIARDELDALAIAPAMRRRIDHGFQHRARPHIDTRRASIARLAERLTRRRP